MSNVLMFHLRSQHECDASFSHKIHLISLCMVNWKIKLNTLEEVVSKKCSEEVIVWLTDLYNAIDKSWEKISFHSCFN